MPDYPGAYEEKDIKVGHAGLYVDADDDTSVDTDAIIADIPLGLAGAGKTLINCEKGIKLFVADQLAGQKNHLPDSETGVWIHYLTEGIIRDFGRTWVDTPVALQGKKSKEEKGKAKGKRGLTKKEKNELIDRLNILYYQKDIESGAITQEEALEKVGEALQEKKKWEDAGYTITMNKTESVGFYNPDRVVIEAYGGDWDALNIYKKHKVKMIIPDVVDAFYTTKSKIPAKYVNVALKSPLPSAAYNIAVKNGMKGWTGKGAVYDEKVKEYGGYEAEDITSVDDLISRLELTKALSDFDIKAISLAYAKQLTQEPVFVFDGVDKKTNHRKLIICDKTGQSTLYDK
jgi:hypothetical protein